MKRSRVIGSLLVLVAGCASSQRGTLVETTRPLDLAIDGEGYFIVDTGHKSYLFTRRGDFYIDADWYLVTEDGHRVAPAIRMPVGATDFKFSLDGKVAALVDGRLVPAGQLRLATFPTPQRLERDGDYVIPTAASGDPTTHTPGSGGAGTIKQKMLEK